ncbi:hypothetical protein D3C78_1318070 [compost metagenome]
MLVSSTARPLTKSKRMFSAVLIHWLPTAMSVEVLLMLPEVDDISTSCIVTGSTFSSALKFSLPALPVAERPSMTVLVSLDSTP